MADDKVYFQFAGEEEIPSRTIEIPSRALKINPDTVLAMLANDVWNTDAAVGSATSNPIVTKPLESLRDSWLPPMADMIRCAYEGKDLVLPPRVELEEVLAVLDYYGLPVDDPGMIQLNETDGPTRHRARIFVKHSDWYQISLEFVVEKLEASSHYTTTFLFVNRHHDMDYINSENKEVFLPVSRPSLDNCFGQRERFRQKMVADLKADGYEATWQTCRVIVAGPDKENRSFEQRELRYEDLFALDVTIPEPEPVSKRQKL